MYGSCGGRYKQQIFIGLCSVSLTGITLSSLLMFIWYCRMSYKDRDTSRSFFVHLFVCNDTIENLSFVNG